MKKTDVTCDGCGAGFWRLELVAEPRSTGEYRCPGCGNVLETFDGRSFVAYRLTIEPTTRGIRD